MFTSIFQSSLIHKAQKKNIIKINLINIRDFSTDKHKKVDDTPYGGGHGMLMTCQPLFDAITFAKNQAKKTNIVIYLSPQGKKLKQPMIENFAQKYEEIILVCGHYEGIDQRVIDNMIDLEISVGDYILTGGELAAAVFVDAISRLVPNFLGNNKSDQEESFSKKLQRKLEYPQYTRPEIFRGLKVPPILLSGDHQKIEEWKKSELH